MLLLALLVLSVAPQPSTPRGGGRRAAPAATIDFVGVAHAQGKVAAPAAGAAAGSQRARPASRPTTNAATPVNLNLVKGVYRVIEAQTADYIIGPCQVTNYPDTEDVHVYVHKDGWFLAYYLAADPVGKIFNWRQYHDTGRTKITTKLEDTLALVASTAGVTFLPGATHYHFQYPNATHLMLISEWAVSGGVDTFNVKLPGEFIYWEMSWSLGDTAVAGCYDLNSVAISCAGDWQTVQGKFTPAQMLTDQYHTIRIQTRNITHTPMPASALLYTVPCDEAPACCHAIDRAQCASDCVNAGDRAPTGGARPDRHHRGRSQTGAQRGHAVRRHPRWCGAAAWSWIRRRPGVKSE